jgi:hypothetical protein
MNDNIIPDLMPFLAPIPFEIVGVGGTRAPERHRDQAAMELVGYVLVMLRFGAPVDCSAELLKRANKVRASQGVGEVTFVHETAARIRAAAEPGFAKPGASA